MTPDLPPGPWQALLTRAFSLIDDIQHHGGIRNPPSTLGDGTVLKFR